ncbi:MAG: hypothetical protein LBT94_02100 [Prevotellaceae bacterium]|nr:hypothetical protein [Prevotellaceae bacterium]
MDVLLNLMKSWNIEPTVVAADPPKSKRKKSTSLTLSVGMWADRDVSDQQLREQAWGSAKRLHKRLRLYS